MRDISKDPLHAEALAVYWSLHSAASCSTWHDIMTRVILEMDAAILAAGALKSRYGLHPLGAYVLSLFIVKFM